MLFELLRQALICFGEAQQSHTALGMAHAFRRGTDLFRFRSVKLRPLGVLRLHLLLPFSPSGAPLAL